MTYSSSSQSSSAQAYSTERVALSMIAASIMFVAGYTLVRVGFAQNTASTNSAVQMNVVPHQSTLWTDAFSENY